MNRTSNTRASSRSTRNKSTSRTGSSQRNGAARSNGARRKNGASRKNGALILTADTADKHVLYQKSVQAPQVEIDFMDRVFKKAHGRKPLSLREDFCGTALLCAEWVKSNPERTALGVDIDGKVLAWGKKHNLADLGAAEPRITLLQQDVRAKTPGRFDVVCAFNFSYWIFRTREEMKAYFKSVRSALGKQGMFLLDSYGGWEAQECVEEVRRVKGGFKYIWDQSKFDPITHVATNYIHFEFKDGTRMDKAFSYTWRFWSLPEIRELLQEAGFSDVQVYWDMSKTDDEEWYVPRERAENQPGWLAYIIARD